MDIKGRYTFNAPRTRVWALLLDPDVLKGCVPGCESLEPIGDDRYRATVTMGVAAVSGTYDGIVAIHDRHEPERYRLTVEGSGRPGFVKGDAHLQLVDLGTTTEVEVSGTVQVGGLVASVGQRLLGSVSKMMLDRFFACLSSRAETTTSGP